MNNIIRKIKEYYPMQDDSLNLLKENLRPQLFPAKTIIVQANHLDKHISCITEKK